MRLRNQRPSILQIKEAQDALRRDGEKWASQFDDFNEETYDAYMDLYQRKLAEHEQVMKVAAQEAELSGQYMARAFHDELASLGTFGLMKEAAKGKAKGKTFGSHLGDAAGSAWDYATKKLRSGYRAAKRGFGKAYKYGKKQVVGAARFGMRHRGKLMGAGGLAAGAAGGLAAGGAAGLGLGVGGMHLRNRLNEKRSSDFDYEEQFANDVQEAADFYLSALEDGQDVDVDDSSDYAAEVTSTALEFIEANYDLE